MRYLILLMLMLVGCSSDALPQDNTNSISQELHSWSTYHWSSNSLPVSLTLRKTLSSTWAPYLDTTSADWNQSTVIHTTVVRGSNNPKRCAPTLGSVEVCSAAYGKNGWLGIAQIWINGGHITQATVKVNDSYFSMAKYNTVAYRNLVMCQEVGHTFGLDHQDEKQTNTNLGTCMDYTNNPAGPPSNEHPNAHDYEQLELIYSHVDSAVNVSQQSANDSWGQLVDDDGHSRKFVHRLDSNQLLLTHVILAE